MGIQSCINKRAQGLLSYQFVTIFVFCIGVVRLLNIYSCAVISLNICGGSCLGWRRSIGCVQQELWIIYKGVGCLVKKRQDDSAALPFLSFFSVLVEEKFPYFLQEFHIQHVLFGVKLLSQLPCRLRPLVLLVIFLLCFYSEHV